MKEIIIIIIKLLEGITEDYLLNPGIEKNFLRQKKPLIIREKTDEFDYFKN